MSTDTTDRKTASNDVFTVDLSCGNCGDTFSRSFPPHIHVDTDSKGVSFKDTLEFGSTTRIECETCALTREMKIEDRYPIEEDNE